MKLQNAPAISMITKATKNDSHDCEKIFSHIWSRLKLEPEEWRKIYKALYLLDIILKAGDPKCVSIIKGNIYKIKSFQTFASKAGVGAEKGNGIREKAKAICDLLENPELLDEERNKTKQLRNKLSGVAVSSGGKYGGISSSSYGGGYSSYSGGDVMYGGSSGYGREISHRKEPNEKRKTKAEVEEKGSEAEEYKKRTKSKPKPAPAATTKKAATTAVADDEFDLEQAQAKPAPAPAKDLLNLLDFDEGGQKTKSATTTNLTEIMPNLIVDAAPQPEENDFENFTSAPAPAAVPMGNSWDQPAVYAAPPVVPQCMTLFPFFQGGDFECVEQNDNQNRGSSNRRYCSRVAPAGSSERTRGIRRIF